jgi:hypothetical protein
MKNKFAQSLEKIHKPTDCVTGERGSKEGGRVAQAARPRVWAGGLDSDRQKQDPGPKAEVLGLRRIAGSSLVRSAGRGVPRNLRRGYVVSKVSVCKTLDLKRV